MINYKAKCIELMELACEHENISNKRNWIIGLSHNGPHKDIETPIRIVSHLLYASCFLIESGKKEYEKLAREALEYIFSNQARPMNAAFHCRVNPSKDFSNGLVGQAWVLEALMYASEVLNEPEARRLAYEVFMQHKWDEQKCSWYTLNVDGSSLNVNLTFNQQLWFAYIGLQFRKHEEPYKRAQQFVLEVLPNVEIYKDGVIYHDSCSFKKSKRENGIFYRSKKVLRNIFTKTKENKRLHSVGYHSFNLVPIKYIIDCVGDNIIEQKKLDKMFGVCLSERFISELNFSKFSYPYNPVGFELAYSLQEGYEEILNKQLEYIKFKDKGVFVNASYDENLSVARLYEFARCFRYNNNLNNI
ncbi:hypothetical protein BCT86_00120 [Vibrio breoganii]|uniref:hypothetical protein n=1 Tax=Vibrio breoganii TaxID=553239 RepID=UPI000C8388B1|nr:hypothetical protein [Vibrio breoganii]PML10620.1 hypothetical protein BCT86_00120 [Vibrio breoganii]